MLRLVQKDTLIKYLLDELERMEEGHQDALCPTAPEPQRSLMSEHSETQAATKGDVRASHDSLRLQFTEELNTMSGNIKVTVITAVNHAIPAVLSCYLAPPSFAYSAGVYPTPLQIHKILTLI